MFNLINSMETPPNTEPHFTPDLERASSVYSKPSEEGTRDQLILPPLTPQPNTIRPNLPSIKEWFLLDHPPPYSKKPYTSSRPHHFTDRRSSNTPIPMSHYDTIQLPIFISAIEKQARRKFHQINRTFQCIHPGCQKSYGALNHLNSHIVTQKHGRRRKAHEFKSSSRRWPPLLPPHHLQPQ